MKWWSWMWFKYGQIEVECGDESDCGNVEYGDECGDSDAKGTRLAAIPLPPLHPSLHPLPNQSKPIVPIPSFSLSFHLITFRYTSYNFSLYYHNL